MALNKVQREEQTRTPIGGFVNGTTNDNPATSEEISDLETALTLTVDDIEYVARVRSYNGNYAIVRWFVDGKLFTGYKSKEFTTNKAITFITTMIENLTSVPAPTSVSVSPATDSIAEVATTQLTATTSPAGAGDDVTWASSDEEIATVDADGLVTGVAEGEATITATTVSGPSVTDTSVITVTAA